MAKTADSGDQLSPRYMPAAALMLIEITFVEKLQRFVIYPLLARNQSPVH